MKFELPKIYPITDARLSRLSHAEQVERLALGGARFVQLREKYAPADEFYREAVKAAAAADRFGVKLLINDRIDIALAVGAAGVHLGQDDLPPDRARSILGANAVIGFSTHTLEQAAEAAKLPIDYIAFGPIFPTSTKTNADPAVGLELLSDVRRIVGNIPLVAIGGINADNAGPVLTTGADSLAIIGFLLAEPDSITAKTQAFFNLV